MKLNHVALDLLKQISKNEPKYYGKNGVEESLHFDIDNDGNYISIDYLRGYRWCIWLSLNNITYRYESAERHMYNPEKYGNTWSWFADEVPHRYANLVQSIVIDE